MYGVGAVKYKDFVVGYIEKNSFDMGGQKPESAKIEAEQVPGTPVLIIPQSNGSIAPTFNVIQLNYENLHSLLGGTMHYKEEDSEKKTPIGWTAPTAAVLLTGPWEIALVSGTLTETAKIECTLEVAMPEDGSQPHGVFNTDSIPEEWKQYKLPPAESAAAASTNLAEE